MKASESPESVEYQKWRSCMNLQIWLTFEAMLAVFLVYGKAKRENEKVERNSMAAFAFPDPSRTHETPSKLLH